MGALIWAKVVFVFSYSQSFGPIIKMITVMTKDMVTFLLLWAVFILFFVCAGITIFYDLPEFATISEAIIYLCNAAVANFDTSIFGQELPAIECLCNH